MKPGVYVEITDTRSRHVVEVLPIIRNGQRKTDRYWKWFLCEEPSGTVLHLGVAPTKAAALEALSLAEAAIRL